MSFLLIKPTNVSMVTASFTLPLAGVAAFALPIGLAVVERPGIRFFRPSVFPWVMVVVVDVSAILYMTPPSVGSFELRLPRVCWLPPAPMEVLDLTEALTVPVASSDPTGLWRTPGVGGGNWAVRRCGCWCWWRCRVPNEAVVEAAIDMDACTTSEYPESELGLLKS